MIFNTSYLAKELKNIVLELILVIQLKKDIENCLIRNLKYSLFNKMISYYDRCKIVISDMHGLMDKTKEETIKEFNNFIKYLKTIFNGIFKVEIICKKIL